MAEANGTGNGAAGADRISFSDVVRAHKAWDDRQDEASRKLFCERLQAFEAECGSVVDAYWCRRDASAVALTRKTAEHQRLRARLGGAEDEYRLHRVSDWVTGATPAIADLLHDCDVLALKAGKGLEGIPQAVVMQWLHSVEAHVLGFIERSGADAPTAAELQRFTARQRAELERIEDYYQSAGDTRGRLRYVEGMLLFGVPAMVVLAALLAPVLALFGAPSVSDATVRGFYASMAAGAIGAVVSVLMRMSRGTRFTIDHELGRRGVRELGAYRPLIGAVSGIVVHFLVQTPLLPVESDTRTFEFYAVVAFLAGFSERWTRVTLGGAMRTVGGGAEDESELPARVPEPRVVEEEPAAERAPEAPVVPAR
jgi:hypothetical protein